MEEVKPPKPRLDILRPDCYFDVSFFVQGPVRIKDSIFEEGQYWITFTVYGPELESIQQPPRSAFQQHLAYVEPLVVGGLWAMWPSEKAFERREVGSVEYMAAGAGFGQSILMAACRAIDAPLGVGRKRTAAADKLFSRFPQQVARSDGAEVGLRPFPAKLASYGDRVTRIVAVNSYREMGSTVLPRYRAQDDIYKTDPVKLTLDMR